MNKEEARSAVMEAISMTLKDSILQQGFTCICKELADFQKENAELRHQLNKNPCVCNTEWHCNDCLEQLTKAKVALRNVIDYLGQFCSDYPDCVIEAEIILKEE